MSKKEKDWLPDVRKLMQIVQHQKQRLQDQDWLIHNLITTIDKIRSDELLNKKENNLN